MTAMRIRHACVMALVIGCSASSGKGSDPPVRPDPRPRGPDTATGSGTTTTGAAWKNTTPAVEGIEEVGFHDLATRLGLDGPNAPAAVDAGVTARFATVTQGYDSGKSTQSLQVYNLAGGTVTLELETPLPDGGDNAPVIDWEWADATQIVFLYIDGTLARFTGKTVERFARPGKKAFAVKHKKGSGDERLDRDEGLVATASGEVWLHHCVWGYRGDEDPCTQDVYVRVLPSVATSTKAIASRPAVAGSDPVPGWSFTIKPLGDAETGTLVCKGPGGASSELLPGDDGSYGYSADDAVVLSNQPMIQAVKEWVPGAEAMDSVDHLLAGCAALEGESPDYQIGPSELWALWLPTAEVSAERGMILMWRGRIVAQLPGVNGIEFAP